MSYYGKYGSGLESFVQEWGLGGLRDDDLNNPVVYEALQDFLNIISPERGYRLTFINTGTAGTSFSSKKVVCTSAALRGLFIANKIAHRWSSEKVLLRYTNGRRFRITAGMICHEVAHIRYGQDTAGAVEVAFKGNKNLRLAQSISNMLDENRIERAFAYDFPGYGGVFKDVREWVVNSGHPTEYRDGNRPCVEQVTDRRTALQAAFIGARFFRFYYADGTAATQAALEWGKKWEKKYTADDTPELHVAGVKAMIEWLKQFPKGEERPETTTCTFPQPPSPDGGEEGEEEEQTAPGGIADPNDLDDDEDDDESGSNDGEDEDEDESEEDGSGSGSGFNDDEDDEDSGRNGSDDDEDGDDEDGESFEEGEDSLDDIAKDIAKDLPDEVMSDRDVEEAEKSVPDDDEQIDSKNTQADKKIDNARERAARDMEYVDTDPDNAGHFRVRINRNPSPRRSGPFVKPADAAVAAHVRQAFESTRFSHDEWQSGYMNGRFRSRDAARAASGDLNVFSRRMTESSTRVHLALLIDYSGSMDGEKLEKALEVGVTLADAMAGSPVYRQSIWSYRSPTETFGVIQLNRLWETGDPGDIAHALSAGGSAHGSTPTGPALFALGQEMVDDQRPDEAMLVVSITDGSPDIWKQVVEAVAHWTERGVAFLGLMVPDSMRGWYYTSVPGWQEKQRARVEQYLTNIRDQYGDDNGIYFDGEDWKGLATDIAEAVGKALAGTLSKR